MKGEIINVINTETIYSGDLEKPAKGEIILLNNNFFIVQNVCHFPEKNMIAVGVTKAKDRKSMF
ncbi:MAG: hypothetical protein ACOCQR_02355 [bacterium]